MLPENRVVSNSVVVLWKRPWTDLGLQPVYLYVFLVHDGCGHWPTIQVLVVDVIRMHFVLCAWVGILRMTETVPGLNVHERNKVALITRRGRDGDAGHVLIVRPGGLGAVRERGGLRVAFARAEGTLDLRKRHTH